MRARDEAGRRVQHNTLIALGSSVVLLCACSSYDKALLPHGSHASSEGGVDLVADANQRDTGALDANANASYDANFDASSPACYVTNFPDCPQSCGETCNGEDDDCDGKVDEIDSRTTCVLANATAVCAGSTCLIAICDEGHVDCNDVVEDGCETTLDAIDNCGFCGHHCALQNANARCDAGTCQVDTCNAQFGDCDQNPSNGCERPLDTLNDCSACNKKCSAAHATTDCADSQCRFLGCSAGFGDCNGDSAKLDAGDGCETDVSTPQNCGACGHVCANPAPFCSGGKCTSLACPSGSADCNGDNLMCETSLNTLPSCGACGVACGPLANAAVSCSTGSCVPTCKAGYQNCDGAIGNGCETNVTSNTNCDGCGKACSYANASTSCSTGSCQLVSCQSGYGDCNHSLAADGCEQRLNTNVHCGQCGQPCSLANAASTCNSGSCQVSSCASGFANCDGNANTGCEVNLLTDNQNCGACNLACPSNRSCQNGNCVCTSDSDCASGQCCAGSCVNTSSDSANCGSCGNACDTGGACCNGSCKDLTSDTSNCGKCGSKCGSNSNRCSNGSCRCASDNPCSGFNKCCSNGCGLGLLCF